MSPTKYIDLERTISDGGVVHLRDPADCHAAICHGSFGAGTMRSSSDRNMVPTCFWCVVGADGSGIRWFKWADET